MMSPEEIKERTKNLNEHLDAISDEEMAKRGVEQAEKDKTDFENLKKALADGRCMYCGHGISDFIKRKPCFHWLLKPKGFKKKHLPLLLAEKGFHEIEAYLRWVANTDAPIRNINDLVDEGISIKIIEETIKYKHLEWSFSCSQGDYEGHRDSTAGAMPHYHFQMKENERVVINYGSFHALFNDYDAFCFAIKNGEVKKLKHAYIEGAGMKTFMDTFTGEELLTSLRNSDPEDESTHQFHLETSVMADPGTTISGDKIAELMEESKATGIPMAKLVKEKLKNVRIMTVIEPGPAVPEIAFRKPNRGGKRH